MTKGIRADRTLDGGSPVTKIFQVVVSADLAYAIGMPVTLSSGKVRPVAVSSSVDVGVIAALYKEVNGRPAPLTFNMPAVGPYLASGVTGFAQVYVNPNQLFVAEIDCSASVAMIGQTVRVSGAQAINALTGKSNVTLGKSSLGSAPDAHFTIVGISPADRALYTNIQDTGTPGNVEVKVTQPMFKR
jgi:hypothetical protein